MCGPMVTEEQRARLNQLFDERVNLLLNPGREISRKEASADVGWLYGRMDAPPPENIVICDGYTDYRKRAYEYSKGAAERGEHILELPWSEDDLFETHQTVHLNGVDRIEEVMEILDGISLDGVSAKDQGLEYFFDSEARFINEISCLVYNSDINNHTGEPSERMVITNSIAHRYHEMLLHGIWSMLLFEKTAFICRFPKNSPGRLTGGCTQPQDPP